MIDFVKAKFEEKFVIDVVAETFDNPHFKISCTNGIPIIGANGIVFCRHCDATIGSLNDISDSFCPGCQCAISAHSINDGHCFCCGKACRLEI